MSGREPMEMLEVLAREEVVRQAAPQPPYNIVVGKDDVDAYLKEVARGKSDGISDKDYREWYRQQVNESSLLGARVPGDGADQAPVAGSATTYLAERVPTVAEQVHLFMIPAKGLEAARAVKKRLENGEALSRIAREYAAADGGDIGWHPRGGLVPHLAAPPSTRSPVGEVSEPLYLDGETFAVVVVSERAAARELTEAARRRLQDRALDDWLVGAGKEPAGGVSRVQGRVRFGDRRLGQVAARQDAKVIETRDLTKAYGKRVAVDGITLSVGKGEIVGFLGPNGAGKTTTMRMLTGYLMPTSGEVSVAGHNMRTHSLEARRVIGYMPEVVPLYTDMTTRGYLTYAARLRGLDRKKSSSRLDAVVQTCHLEEYLDVVVGKLSKGFRQRVGLAQAIIHEPEVLILDEPTAGIDPIQVAQTRELIRQLGRDHTILLSTHILPEVSMICRRVVIIHRGRIVAEDRIENLSGILRAEGRLRLKVEAPAEDVTERLRGIAPILRVSYEAPYHTVSFAADQSPHAEITEVVVRSGWTLLAMEPAAMSLEDIFLELTTDGETGR